MSTDWNIHCQDCADTFCFNDANHQLDMMRAIIRHRDAIALLVPLFSEPSLSLLELSTSFGRIDPRWFQEHAGHALVPISEYGDIDS